MANIGRNQYVILQHIVVIIRRFQRIIQPIASTITDYTNPIPTRLRRTPIFPGHGNRRNERLNACKYSDFVASIGIEQLIKERQQSFRGIYEPVSRAWLANRELYAQRRQRPACIDDVSNSGKTRFSGRPNSLTRRGITRQWAGGIQ